MLEVKGIDTYYGNIQALRDVSLRVDDGEIVTLIGANGAGKSTTLMTICGINRPRKARYSGTASPSTSCPRTRSSAWASRRCPKAASSSPT